MKKLFFILLLLAFVFPAFAQRFVDEVPTLAALKTRNVFNLNQSVFVREPGVGGLFKITNSAILVDEIFRVASTHNAAWSYDRIFDGPVDLRWGGAVGDGTAGDNTKIANVVNAAASRGYAALLSNLTGVGATNQFQLSIIPTLRANQNYLQIGSVGGMRVVTEASSNFLFSSFGQHVFDRGLIVGTNTRVNLGGLAAETTNGLFLATMFNKAAGDPTRAYMLAQVNKDATNMNEAASAQIFVNSTNAYLIVNALDTNAVAHLVQISAETNNAGVLITKGGSPIKEIYLGIGPKLTSLIQGPQLIINGTNFLNWNDDSGQLSISRGTSNGSHLLSLTDGGGVSPVANFYGNQINYPNTGLHVSANDGINFSIRSPWILRLDPYASVIIGDGNTNTARATNFLYIPTLAGPPTGTPTNYTGTAPLALDSVNGNLYVNNGSSWILIGGLGGNQPLNFGDQFDVGFNTNINLSIGLRTTNQVLEGNVIAPSISLGSKSGAFDIDAGSSLELNFLLAGDATITITNFNDYHPLSVVFTNAGNFAITWADTMYWIPNGNATQVTNDWGAGIINRFTFWRSGGRIMASDKEGLSQLGGGGASGGNPSASVGLTAINGVSALFMRSDAAPPLSQAIAPTWTANHIFNQNSTGLITPVTLRNPNTNEAFFNGIEVPFYLRDRADVEYLAGKINVSKTTGWTGAATADSQMYFSVVDGGASKILMNLVGNANSYYQSPFVIGATDPYPNKLGFLFTSPESATAGNQKNSPLAGWSGQGWNPTTSLSEEVTVGAYVIPVQEAANSPSARWILEANTVASPTGAPILEVTSKSSVILGERLALATTATAGFVYIPTSAGPPTGVPTAVTGKVAMEYDTVNSQLLVYNAGWKDVAGPGFVRLPISQATLPTAAPARLDFVSTTGLKRLLFATNETCYFQFTLPQDYGTSPVLRIPYSCSGATSGTASFSVSVWAQSPGDALDADTESYDTANVGTDTVPGTLNFPDVVLVTLTTADGMVAGDTVAIRITSTSNSALNDLRVRGDMVLEYAKQ